MGRGRRLRRLALAAAVSATLALITALGALAADNDGRQSLGVSARPSAPATAGAAAGRGHAGARSVRPPAPRPTSHLAGAGPSRAVVTMAPAAGGPGVPRSFLGISTEYWALPLFERQMPVLERTLSLLRAPGDGPLLMRIGGDSADHSFWAPKARPMPAWAFELTPEWLQQTGELVRNLDLRLILDLNLVTDTPGQAGQWAQAAESQLPADSISGFEIGNEPDIYNHLYWLTTVAGSKVVPPTGLTAHTYAHDFQAYARALGRTAPGVPLLGPALANPSLNRDWISALLASRPARPAAISVHRYPYSACALPGTAAYPTIARVLSEHASAGVAESVKPAVAIARHAGIPVRLTELNSVTCGGRAGVSNVFATALWAPDALFELLRAGVAGVNIHVRARAINAAFALNRGGLQAKPLLYGLIAFTRMLGPDAQLVPLQVHASLGAHLKVWGVRVRGGVLHVLLIDKGQQSVDVSLRLRAKGAATVQRLLAPSPSAGTGVTLDGQYLDAGGTWRGRAAYQLIDPGADGYAVALPRYSAALLTVHLPGETSSALRLRERDRVVRLERPPLAAEGPRRRAGRVATLRRAPRRGSRRR